jgi:hypothetical protein
LVGTESIEFRRILVKFAEVVNPGPATASSR